MAAFFEKREILDYSIGFLRVHRGAIGHAIEMQNTDRICPFHSCKVSSKMLYYSITKKEKIMKIESSAILSRRIRNLKRDIQSVRHSGDTLRMRILYRQLTQAQISLVAQRTLR